jgi:hypothetical protein
MLAAAAVTAPARRGVAARSCGAELRRASGARVFRRMRLSARDSSESLRQRRLSVPLRDAPGRPFAVAAGTFAVAPGRRDVF